MAGRRRGRGEGSTHRRKDSRWVVYNTPDRLDLHLFMGPGTEKIRRRLFEMAANHDVFVQPRPSTPKAIRVRSWPSIFTRHLLKPESYEQLDREGREQEIRAQWGHFIERDLPWMDEALKKEEWIWESVEEDGST